MIEMKNESHDRNEELGAKKDATEKEDTLKNTVPKKTVEKEATPE